MFGSRSSDRWSWSSYVERPVDFCVHALQRDGLRVRPFDQHPDGDRSLRDAGLDAWIWQTWLTTVIDGHARLNGAAVIADKTKVDHQAVIDLAESFFSPWRLCPGPTAIKARLEALWAEFEGGPNAEPPDRKTTAPERDLMDRLLPDGGARIWRGLVPYHEWLSTLNVYLVDYVAPAVLTIPPLTCVIAAAADHEAYARQVISAAEALAAG